ncbi:hypothetical protein ACWDV4_14800 [Micromonospora sp. NPDC003197]
MRDATPQPLGTPEEFHQMLVDIAVDFAPRRFAICEEYGDRLDGRVFAWGLAFEEQALVSDVECRFLGRFQAADSAVRLFSRTGRHLRLIWVDEVSSGPAESL